VARKFSRPENRAFEERYVVVERKDKKGSSDHPYKDRRVSVLGRGRFGEEKSEKCRETRWG